MNQDKPYKDQHALSSKIYEGYVEHKRKKPRAHAFRYGLYFYCFDLDELAYLDQKLPLFGYNRIRPAAIFDKDYLDEGNQSIRQKVERRLAGQAFAPEIGRIFLVTSARYLNYIFNPVSFYYVLNAHDELLCVLAEVNNTFGDKHLYVLTDRKDSGGNEPARYQARKAFHVSPFNTIEGDYHFSFSALGETLEITIELVQGGEVLLEARLYGRATALTGKNQTRLLLRHPLVAHLTTPRILFEALRLFFLRRLKYIEKPQVVDMMTIRRKGK
jgi:cyclopropane-fatty-acyl-phospholipid synthase